METVAGAEDDDLRFFLLGWNAMKYTQISIQREELTRFTSNTSRPSTSIAGQ